uniref:Uncharacterized protein n=1 Tax=Neobodo designis TaxID=312471 RepID=A0A7S1L8A5_NEODS|mmetsp:Transcript_16839/g.52299  ORF Transcript_16839/g.52299 Transcript_16839/m.52299 type:complete len:277 (+) Transcript_16839:189-1019(+)|eukprot:CAMPEP_0174851632 /NCGR_PEP_ID=MMETSP1114-20130205/23294_1 /TAXON_ID=312471 /ORGANISM="Neobodo designis, Strain CCAP 1951/1" /LENGTH=276 /DNA_ID=CAMNT_0016086179 /DNA_START=189 /DNA_END=1019 /DNA_ORIENTATION=-
MLRRTSAVLAFNPATGPANQCGHPTNENMDELIRYIKHAKKLRQYFGSHFQRIPDREAYYNAYGGPKAGRFVIRRTTTKRQYYHHNATKDRWAIHSHNTKSVYSGVGGGGIYKNIWDNQVSGTNAFWDVTFKMFGKDLDKDKAIEWMEGWGTPFKLQDEYVEPRMADMAYQRHALYADNFPWIKDPEIGGWKGDADYQWKGRESIDYTNHGAATKAVANEFRSLWGIPEKKPVAAAPAAAAKPAKKAKAAKKAEEAPKAADAAPKKDAGDSGKNKA